jgi:malonate transporter and related proteins
MLLVYFAWYFAVRVALKTSRADASLQALTIAFPNLAGVGLPVTSAVLGSGGAAPVAIALATGSILVTPITLILVEMSATTAGKPTDASASQLLGALKRALTRPVVAAPALGILFSLFNLRLGAVADASLMLIGQAAAGVALFLTGLILSAQPFDLDWKIVGATGMADVIRPLTMALVVFSLPVSAETAKMAVLLSAVPSGFFGILFAVNYRLNSASMGSMVLASTAFSAVTMAITIAVLFPH